MYIKVTKIMFISKIIGVNPHDYSFIGLGYLYDYLIEQESIYNNDLELDIISICNEWKECNTQKALNNHGIDSLAKLKKITTVIIINVNSVIYKRVLI